MSNAMASSRSVTTPFLTWFGLALLSTSVVFAAFLLLRHEFLGAFFVACLFGASGAGLLLMGGRLTADATGIRIKKPLSDKTVLWDEIAGVRYGGGNLVFDLKSGGRVVAPSSEFWFGLDKAALVSGVRERLAERGITAASSARAVAHAGDRE